MIPIYFVRTPLNYDLDEASDASAIDPGGPSLTVQSQTPDVDINVLMQRYGLTGEFPENPRVPQYGDFEHISDFRSAIDAVRLAEEKFMEFPAATRAFFNNDPQLMLDFASDPANLEALKANQVNLDGQVTNRSSSSSGGAQAASSRGGAAQRDAGAAVSERSAQSGAAEPGKQVGSA